MSESLDKLTKLTEEMNGPSQQKDEYGLTIGVVKTVDQKLGQATDIIREAQDALSATNPDNVAVENAKNIANNAKKLDDNADTLAQLTEAVSELKAEIKEMKNG